MYKRQMQKDGRIVYLTETKKENLFWNIPIANTTVILLGSGTSAVSYTHLDVYKRQV